MVDISNLGIEEPSVSVVDPREKQREPRVVGLRRTARSMAEGGRRLPRHGAAGTMASSLGKRFAAGAGQATRLKGSSPLGQLAAENKQLRHARTESRAT